MTYAAGSPVPGTVDLLGVEALLTNEERLVQATVREFVRDRVLPDVAEWFEQGILPRELGREL